MLRTIKIQIRMVTEDGGMFGASGTADGGWPGAEAAGGASIADRTGTEPADGAPLSADIGPELSNRTFLTPRCDPEDIRFLITAETADGDPIPPRHWKNLLFSRHEETFYGAFVREKNGGLLIDGWELATLLAKESFNRLVRWDWDETAQICVAAADAIYEAVTGKEWLPDFDALANGMFRWQLPVSVTSEFPPAFWEQTAGGLSAQQFLTHWYNGALAAFFQKHEEWRERLGKRLEVLRNRGISGRTLAAYFDGETWRRWLGLEDGAPFTVGLRLEEPAEAYAPWDLAVFLRGKKEPNLLVDVSDEGNLPGPWKRWLGEAAKEAERWVRLFPWLDGMARDEAPRTEAGARGGVPDAEAGVPATGDGGCTSVTQRLARKNLGLARHLTEDEAWLFLTEASEVLLALGVEILLPAWWQALTEARFKVKAQLKGAPRPSRSFFGLDALVDFNWRFAMNGVELTEEEFYRLVEEKRRLVYIREQWIKLDPEFVRQIQRFMKKAEKEGLHIRDVMEQELLGKGADRPGTDDAAAGDADGKLAAETDERSAGAAVHAAADGRFAAAGADASQADFETDGREMFRIQIELNRHWRKMLTELRNIKAIPDVPVPAGFRGRLRPYQKQGMNWLLFLRQYGFGAILADDMGLGKTVQLIAYLLAVKEQEGDLPGHDAAEIGTTATAGATGPNGRHPVPRAAGPALIICPTSVLGNWQKELERFAPGLRVYLHFGPDRPKEEAFFEKIRTTDVVITSYGHAQLDFPFLSQVEWDTIAIDEAQNIKNSHTKQSRAVRKLRGRHHIAMTGTPMENRLTELWTIFDFTNRGYLGSLRQFQRRFAAPIEKGGDKEKIRELQALIRPFLLRRTKQDEEVALNLPEKLEQKEYCPLTAEQAALYEQLVADSLAEVERLTGMERRGLILQLLNRLKQLCDHPALYLKEERPRRLLERSVKLEKLVEMIEAALEQQESCLIFTQYIGMGEIIRRVLRDTFGMDVPFLNGSVGKRERDAMIARFQAREFPVFLLSLKAGGTGLNLTAANHVIHYDRWWNPAVENQATDRAYRIGQKRFVHVHKLICAGTLEEKIDTVLEQKQTLNDEIIQTDHWITELTNPQLKQLIKLN